VSDGLSVASRARARSRFHPSFLIEPVLVDEFQLRLPLAMVLAAAAVFFFRQAAWPAVVVTLVSALVTLGLVWTGFHRLGSRRIGAMWPGVARGLATALMLVCLLPPLLPLPLVAALAAMAVILEGRLRQAVLPLAFGGLPLGWVLGWAWQARNSLSYVSPFDLRHLEDPVRLWNHFEVAVDPGRLYSGNVAGLLGVSSFGLVALTVLVLAYARKSSGAYVLGYAVAIASMVVATGQPLSVYLLSGPGLAFAGLVGGDLRRLPRHPRCAPGPDWARAESPRC
jgi:hypothetical protein